MIYPENHSCGKGWRVGVIFNKGTTPLIFSKMQEQQLSPLEAQRLIVKTFNDHPDELGEATLPRTDFFGKLFRRKRTVKLQLRGISSGVSQDIALRLMEMIGAKDIDGLPSSDQILKLLGSNTKPLADAIAMGIQNDTDKPYLELSRAILYQFTNGQIHEMLKLVYGRLDLEPFFDSMTLAKSLVINLTQDREALGQ